MVGEQEHPNAPMTNGRNPRIVFDRFPPVEDELERKRTKGRPFCDLFRMDKEMEKIRKKEEEAVQNSKNPLTEDAQNDESSLEVPTTSSRRMSVEENERIQQDEIVETPEGDAVEHDTVGLDLSRINQVNPNGQQRENDLNNDDDVLEDENNAEVEGHVDRLEEVEQVPPEAPHQEVQVDLPQNEDLPLEAEVPDLLVEEVEMAPPEDNEALPEEGHLTIAPHELLLSDNAWTLYNRGYDLVLKYEAYLAEKAEKNDRLRSRNSREEKNIPGARYPKRNRSRN